MKKNFLSFALMAIIIIGLTTSCSNDSSTSPSTPTTTEKMSEYMPSTIGTWWKYENFDTDTNGVKTKVTGYDSTFINSIKMLAGKMLLK